jgi:hypothetical protein
LLILYLLDLYVRWVFNFFRQAAGSEPVPCVNVMCFDAQESRNPMVCIGIGEQQWVQASVEAKFSRLKPQQLQL